jgi:hypothetical protein
MPQSLSVFAVSLQEHPELLNALCPFYAGMSIVIIVHALLFMIIAARSGASERRDPGDQQHLEKT